MGSPSKRFYRLFSYLLVFALIWCGIGNAACAQTDTSPSATQVAEQELEGVESHASADEKTETKVFHPRETSEQLFDRGNERSSILPSLILFVVMVAAVAAFFIYSKRKGIGTGIPQLSKTGDLKIRETKALGNRQFLVVVEYGEQRMLLGVAPGMINHLCYLEDGSAASHLEIPNEHMDGASQSSKA